MIFTYKIDEEIELVLRDDSHAKRYVELVQNNLEHLSPYFSWATKDFNEEAALDYIYSYKMNFANNKEFYLGILYKGQLCGEIGYNFINRIHKTCTIGYWVGKAFVRNGIISRVMKALLYDAFVTRGLNRVALEIAVENKPSQKVAESLGFTFEGINRQGEWLHDHFADMKIYSMIKQDYKP